MSHEPQPSSLSFPNAVLPLMVGCGAIVLVMALHPTGHDLIDESSRLRSMFLGRAVHALAIAALPLLLTGMAALSWRLRRSATLSALGLASFLLGVFAILAAAAMSGFVATAMIDRLPADAGAARDLVLAQFAYTGTLNQAFATVYVGMAGVAFVCWSLAMRGDRAFPRALGWYGCVAGLLPLIGVAAGHLRLDTQGFGLLVLLQATWMAWAGFAMRRAPAITSTPA